MPIPRADRVIFERNPLKQVICQLRFPTILRIDTVLPADFQDEIRTEYPLLRERAQDQNIALPQELIQMLPAEFKVAGNKAYDFTSADEKWVISLSKDFLALSSGDYRKWEDFKTYLLGPLDALVKNYKPAFYSRIGLRYQNIIKRSDLGLENVGWDALLQPYIAGILSSASTLPEEMVMEFRHNELIRLDDSQKRLVRMQYALVKEEGSTELCFYIDNDLFTTERVDIEDVDTILEYLHEQSGRFFHWCITKRLRNAMGPTSV